jgi:two-component system response regulator
VRVTNPSLLLVEDNSDDESLSLAAISSSGVPCDVHVIRHGGDAVKSLITASGPVPDLIVLDFHLPGFNGLEILRELRKQERTRYVPVVMLSALESDTDISDCLVEGANSCVKKPMDPELYIDHVALIIRYWLTVDQRPEKSD